MFVTNVQHTATKFRREIVTLQRNLGHGQGWGEGDIVVTQATNGIGIG